MFLFSINSTIGRICLNNESNDLAISDGMTDYIGWNAAQDSCEYWKKSTC